jgi:hypothetical protein
VFLILLGTAACSDAGEGSPDTTAAAGSETSSGPETTVEADIYADLPTGNYSSYKFSILNSTSSPWAINTMSAETMSGETINDAIFSRNLAVKEKLAIDIAVTDSNDVANTVRTQYQAGDTAYDCIFLQAASMTSLVLTGNLYDLNEIDEIDQEAPWWYPQTNGPLNFGKYTYMLLSDANLSFYESYYMVAFNKELIAKYSDMKNPYDLVYSNEWTIDKMNEMIVEAAVDLNGDGVMDSTVDQFGVCGANNIGYSVMGSLCTSPLTYDENNVPSYTEVSEKFIDAYKKVISTMYDTKYTATSATPGNSTLDFNGVFSAGRGLFLVQVSGTLKNQRESSTDYGIVTLPKYDSAQEKYMSTITPTGCSCVAIIANNPDTVRTGTVVENLAALSHKIILPAYYDITLSYKYAKDQTSIEMLNTIYQNGYLEIAYVYNFGSIRTTIQNMMIARSDSITSTLGTISKLVKKQISDAVAKLCN